MPVTIEERYGRRRSDTSAEKVYLITGADSVNTAYNELSVAADPTFGDLVLDDVEVEEIEGTERYIGRAKYAAVSLSGGSSVFGFDTTGGTQHITQSLETVSKTPASAPDYKQAIGVTEDSVEGVDVSAPQFAFEKRKLIPHDNMTTAYIGNIYALTGSINAAPISIEVDSGLTLSFAAGELLFLGASGSRSSEGHWDLSFRFAASPNAVNLPIGDITVAAKRGWDYVWARYMTVKDETANAMVKRPVAAYVERVYREGDFTALNLNA